jgi:saccharopepsin
MPTSSLSFGSYDLDKYALSDFSYVPVDWTYGNWIVSLQSLTFGKKLLDKYRNVNISTGTSLIYISFAAYEAAREVTCKLVNCYTGQDLIVFDCENGEEAKLPEMTFKLGEHDFPLSPKHYIRREKGLCYLQMLSTTGDVDILGYPFLRAYYSLFDAETHTIGFARSLNNPLPPGSWYIWLGVGLGLLVFAGVIVWFVWCRSNKKTAQSTTDLMEPLIRTNDE